ncbi:hypothetical protein Tco_0202024 [Tanacetum coccineum]
MKEEFPGWFVKQIRQRTETMYPCVNESRSSFALGLSVHHQNLILVNSCVVNGVRFVVHSRDERRITQNSGICLPGPDEEMYYGQLEQILEFFIFVVQNCVVRVKWFDTSNKGHVDVPPDIIDVVDEDDDIIDEEDPIPHDLADSDDEDLANLDIDDGVNVVYSCEEED